MKRLAFLLLWPSLALGQFAVDQQVDSARALFSINATYSASFQFEGVNTLGNPVLVGTPTKMVVNFITTPFILADIAGNKASAVTVSSLRATFTVTGLVGWDQVTSFAVRSKPFTPFAIAAGQKVGCRYDMPGPSFSIATMSFDSAPSGRLRCQPGVLAAAIPAPTVVPVVIAPPPPPPPPVLLPPAPTPVPTPTPPPPITISPDGTKMPPATQIIAADGAVWTMGPPNIGTLQFFRNGTTVGNGVSLCKSIDIYAQDVPPGDPPGSLWQQWLNPGWSAHVATPAGC